MADAEHTLRNLIDDVVDKQTYNSYSVKIKPITSEGANYTSALYIATVSAPKCQDMELFAKVGIVGGKLRARMNADLMYATEMFVYTKLVKVYKDLEEKYNIPDEHRFIFPKFYGCNTNYGEETVLLENLVAKGYNTANRFHSMDWEHAASAVKALAKFHALSFAYEKDNPEEFQRTLEEKKSKAIERDDNLIEIWKNMIRGAIQATKEENKAKVAKYLESHSEKFSHYRNPLGRAVLAHGDYRPSNLLFKKQSNELLTIPVDYQTVHTGCPVSDLIYFIFMGTDREFRQKYYHQLLDHYHEQLTAALNRFHIHAEDVYSKELFHSELEEMLPYALLLGVVILPLVTVESQSAPKLDGGDAEFSQFVVKPNELYADRFNGIISDFVEWNIIE